ncbi:MAG: sigma-70 family RNA polymerase sigma factor [Thermoanaerobaculia bacterium]|nr:sigma-70 family RNA polymerase sigma factor [Thermoanaerobaculia bacterium]
MTSPNPEGRPPEPPQLVEHFFRHESAILVSVLTRAFGVHSLDLVEDAVQEALLAAVQAWSRRGVPDNPAGWIYRVARNRILDTIRRQKIHQRVTAQLNSVEAFESRVEEWLQEERLPDSLLRMMFVCCHPTLDRRSQIALTLKILCGFSVAEVARALLISREAAKKRVQRAKKTLAATQIQLELPSSGELPARLEAVHDVLYLLFNEGYSSTLGHEPLRDDLCEEAARLSHMLCEYSGLSTPESRALLALMLAHAARLEARVDSGGNVVLLEDQDRSRWDRPLIHHAQQWFERSKTDPPSRFHLEAGIALTHSLATNIDDTDWQLIVQLYDRLIALHDSPVYILNRAVARAELGDVELGLAELMSIRNHSQMRHYILLDCAIGRLHERAGNPDAAATAYTAARSAATAPHEQALLDRKLARLTAEAPAICSVAARAVQGEKI